MTRHRPAIFIAEENRLRAAAAEIESEAEELFFALSIAKRRRIAKMDDRDLPGQMGELYRQAAPLREQADRLWDRIKQTKPCSVAGAIAMLEDDDKAMAAGELTLVVLGWLRDIRESAALADPGQPSAPRSAPRRQTRRP